MGRSLNAEGIKAGDDVYFDCHVDARPTANRIEWRRDVFEIELFFFFFSACQSSRPHLFFLFRALN